MKKTKNKIFLYLFSSLLVLSVIGIFVYKNTKKTLALFTGEGGISCTYGAELPESFNISKKGVKLVGKKQGDSILIKDISGIFSLDFLGYSENENGIDTLKNVQFKFIDCSNENNTFILNLDSKGSEYNSYIIKDGIKAGIYTLINSEYAYANGNYEITAKYNELGKYTLVSNDHFLKMEFNPETVSVKLGNYLVWDFSQRYNDGRDIGLTLSGFEKYDVEIIFNELKADYDSVLFVDCINGETVESETINQKSGPSIYAKKSNEGVANKKYYIPKPFSYDIVDGQIDPLEVNVLIKNGDLAIFDGPYTLNSYFVPQIAGKYTIQYLVKNKASISSTKEIEVNVYSSSNSNIDFDYEISNQKLGVGSKLELPTAMISGPIYNGHVDAMLTIYKDGAEIEEYKNLKADSKISIELSELGEYKIHYFSPLDIDDFYKDIIIDSIDYPALKLDYEFNDLNFVGEMLSIPNAVISYKGTSVNASSIIIFPNGESYYNKEINLEKSGKYVIKYIASINGVQYTIDKAINVFLKGSNFFELENGTLEYGVHSINNKYSGLRVKQSTSSTLIYNNIINLNDNGKDDPLIELCVDPSEIGKSDFSIITITLEDLYDESNYITIVIEDSSTVNGKGSLSYVRTGHSGLQLGCFSPTAGTTVSESFIKAGKWQGSQCYHSFMGNLYEEASPQVPIQTLKLFFDYENKALYHDNLFDSYLIGLFNKKGIDYRLIADYDSADCYRELWGGFTDGLCRLKIKVTGESQANYIIMNIDGVDFTKDVINEHFEQKISVDVPNNIPVALVNREYKIFDAQILNNLLDSNLSTRVFLNYDYDGGCEIQVKNGSFTPKAEGIYTILYTATNSFGYENIYRVNVECVKTITPITLEEISAGDTSFEIGTPILLKEYIANGGSGDLKIVKKVVYASSNQKVDIINNSFTPLKGGEYKVKITAYDYIGNECSLEYSINVTVSKNPIWENEIVMPKALLNGSEYIFSDLYAIDYYSDIQNPLRIKSTIKIYDGNGEHTLNDTNRYVAYAKNSGDLIKIVFVASSSNGVSEKTYEVPCYFTKVDNQISMKNYFYTENISINEYESSLGFETNSNDAIFEFSKPLIATSFNVVFNINSEKNNANKVLITLTDTFDINEKIVIEFIKQSSKSSMRINGGPLIEIEGSYFGDSGYDFKFSYDNSSFEVRDSSGKVKALVTNKIDGSRWTGFSSKLVYLDAKIEEVSGEFELFLKSLNGQPLSNYTQDNIAPVLYIDGDVGGEYAQNTTVTIPKIIASDVLSEIKSAKVSVKGPDKKYLTSSTGVILKEVDAYSTYDIVLNEFGRYQITYSIEDTTGKAYNITTKNIFILVSDTEGPTVVINGEIPTECNINTTINIPSISATDNIDDESKIKKYVYVIKPNNIMEVITSSSYTFEEKGNYIIEYYVYDSSMNYKLIKYNVNVK